MVTVYVVRSNYWKKDCIKIGATQCLEKRLNQLFTKKGKFELIFAIQAPPYMERILLKVSKPHLLNKNVTDWFYPGCLPLVGEIVGVYNKYKNRDQRGRIIKD